MRRRDFLRYLTLSASLPVLTRCGGSGQSVAVPTGPHAIIIGGGLAGLCAAWELQESGWRTTIVEARDRLGGRVDTRRGLGPDQQHAEAGGEFIDGAGVHRYFHEYCGEFGVSLVSAVATTGEASFFTGGEHIPYSEVGRLSDAVWIDVDRYWMELSNLAAQIADVTDPVGSDIGIQDYTSAKDFLDQLGLEPTARRLVEHWIRSAHDEPDQVSLLYLAQRAAVYANSAEADIEAFRVAGGNDGLVQAFASRLNSEVRLNTPVTRVEQSDAGVVVTAGGQPIAGDYVICTAPFPAVRNISFVPALPDALQQAVADLNYGHHTKVLLVYADRIWQENGLNGQVMADTPIGRTWDATSGQTGEAGVLATLTSGVHSENLRGVTTQGIAEWAAGQVDALFPGAQEQWLSAIATTWQTDPWAGGAFSAYGLGNLFDFGEQLRARQGRLVFAGEHTDDLFAGYMEGALRSGIRASQQLAALEPTT